MSWKVRASHLEPGAVGPGAEEEGSLHGHYQDDDVASAHLDLLSRRHEMQPIRRAARLGEPAGWVLGHFDLEMFWNASWTWSIFESSLRSGLVTKRSSSIVHDSGSR